MGASEGLGAIFKEHLLSVLCNLLSNFGPVASRRGPLDAQIAFLNALQDCDFTNSSIARGVEIIVKIGTNDFNFFPLDSHFENSYIL